MHSKPEIILVAAVAAAFACGVANVLCCFDVCLLHRANGAAGVRKELTTMLLLTFCRGLYLQYDVHMHTSGHNQNFDTVKTRQQSLSISSVYQA